jgi:microcystin-dependent protein
MGEYFTGEVRMIPYGVLIPTGWTPCDGRPLSVAQNAALYTLIGGTYGEDNAKGTFNLPDLRARTAVGTSGNYPLGATGGVETVVLIESQMPAHNHYFNALAVTGTQINVQDALPAGVGNSTNYPMPPVYAAPSSPLVEIEKSSVQPAGNSQSHTNMQPSLSLIFVIATSGGIQPS